MSDFGRKLSYFGILLVIRQPAAGSGWFLWALGCQTGPGGPEYTLKLHESIVFDFKSTEDLRHNILVRVNIM